MPDRYGMLDPVLTDAPDKPFSYFAHPNDVLGAFGAPVASEVTPEGYIFTGFGELMFLIGNPPRPTWQRHRTLLEGFLPAVEYGIEQDGIRYEWLMFAADLGESLKLPHENRIRMDYLAVEEGMALIARRLGLGLLLLAHHLLLLARDCSPCTVFTRAMLRRTLPAWSGFAA